MSNALYNNINPKECKEEQKWKKLVRVRLNISLRLSSSTLLSKRNFNKLSSPIYIELKYKLIQRLSASYQILNIHPNYTSGGSSVC
jgi:hypothetical protein